MQANIDKEYMNALSEAADEGEISQKDYKRMSEANINSVEGGADQSAQQQGDIFFKKILKVL